MILSLERCRRRLVFDHLPKTAGQAVNAWLMHNLESGGVTQNLIGYHSDLLAEFGHRFFIISAHLAFNNEGFNPSYDYVTIFREPLDRAISWLYFVLAHGCSANLVKGWAAVNADRYLCVDELFNAVSMFVASDGDEVHPVLKNNLIGHHLDNPYVHHLLSIRPGKKSIDISHLKDPVGLALDVVHSYKKWGLYERLSEFVSDLAKILLIPVPSPVTLVNVT